MLGFLCQHGLKAGLEAQMSDHLVLIGSGPSPELAWLDAKADGRAHLLEVGGVGDATALDREVLNVCAPKPDVESGRRPAAPPPRRGR